MRRPQHRHPPANSLLHADAPKRGRRVDTGARQESIPVDIPPEGGARRPAASRRTPAPCRPAAGLGELQRRTAPDQLATSSPCRMTARTDRCAWLGSVPARRADRTGYAGADLEAGLDQWFGPLLVPSVPALLRVDDADVGYSESRRRRRSRRSPRVRIRPNGRAYEQRPGRVNPSTHQPQPFHLDLTDQSLAFLQASAQPHTSGDLHLRVRPDL